MQQQHPFLDLNAIDEAIQAKHLLKHPFYQAWTKGELSLDALRNYARQYYKQVEAFPLYLGSVYSRCTDVNVRRKVLENLIEEDWGENNHPELWLRFAEGIGVNRNDILNADALDETNSSVDTLHLLTRTGSAAGGMAALYAYESMVPEVAEAKIAGLKAFYGIDDERTLSFFTVHEAADRIHREMDRDVMRDLCDSEEKGQECTQAAKAAVDALWSLLDGVQRHYVDNSSATIH